MKKSYFLILLLLVAFVTACGSSSNSKSGVDNKKTRTIEDLMDAYVIAYTKADIDAAKKIFPKYYNERYKDQLTKERLEESLSKAKNSYGDDFNITYEIKSKTKMTDDELNAFNTSIATRFNTSEKASECYKLDGTITFTGSKFTDPDPLSSAAYCKYDGEWYLASVY